MTEHHSLYPIARLTASRLGVAVSSALLATVLTVVLRSFLEQNVFLLFLVAILISSLHGGLWAGLVCVTLSVLGLATFVFPPTGSPLMTSAVDIGRTAVLAFMSVVVVLLAQLLLATRHRANEQAREARIGEESFRDLFDNIADALYVYGPTGRVLNANAAAAALHGLPREQLLGMSWDALADPAKNDFDAIRDALERAFAGLPQSVEVWIRHPDGRSFRVEAKMTGARYFGRGVVLAVARDLSERHTLEEQLRHSQKMEAVGRLAGGVAHDFNNLLTSIRGYASLMRDRVAHDPTLIEDLTEIERGVDLAAAITSQLLAFSRKQEYLPAAVSLNQSLERMEGLLRRLIGEHIELVIEKDPALGYAMLDEGQIEQIVMNLVANARDSLGATGRIVIRTRDVHAVSPAGSWVVLSVGDNGAGMDEPTRMRIFEPFFTTKATGHGTGLGLSTVYGIVKQSGGHIEVESVPGGGSTFAVMFPRIDPAVARDGAAPAAPGTAGPDGTPPVRAEESALVPGEGPIGTILLAEDEEPVRNLVRRILTRSGYRVIEGANGREALEALRAHGGEIDALVTDVIMPELSGPELADHLREERPKLPVLFTSGYNEEGMEGTGVVSGLGIAFLQKPFVPHELVSLLAELLNGDHASR